MGGGKGGGGSSGQLPDFVVEGTKNISEKSQQLFDISKPLLEEGTSQIASLISTGGPGARVPIINQAVSSQESANRQVQKDITGDLRRAGLERGPIGTPGGVRNTAGTTRSDATTGPVTPGNFEQTTPFSAQIREMLGLGGAAAANRIPVTAALPLQSAAIAGGLSGGSLSGAGFEGGLSALGASSRVGEAARIAAKASRKKSGIELGEGVFGLFDQLGGFDKLADLFSGSSALSGVGVDSPAFSGFTPRPIGGELPF